MISIINIWIWFFVVTKPLLTSSANLGYLGNAKDPHGNPTKDVPGKFSGITQTPPTVAGMEDTKNHKGEDSGGQKVCEVLCAQGEGGTACLCDWPPLKHVEHDKLKI